MRKIWPFVILAILSLLFLASELILPYVFAKNIEEQFKNYLVDYSQLAVRVKSVPALNLLRGKIDQIVLEGEDLVIEGLAIDEVITVLEDIQMKKEKGLWSLQGGEMTGLRMVLSEEAVNSYLKANFGPYFPTVSLRPGLANLAGSFVVLERELDLVVEGYFYVKDSRYLCFEPRRLLLEDIQIPNFLTQGILEEAGFQLDLALLPFPFKIDQVQIGDEKVVLLTRDY